MNTSETNNTIIVVPLKLDHIDTYPISVFEWLIQFVIPEARIRMAIMSKPIKMHELFPCSTYSGYYSSYQIRIYLPTVGPILADWKTKLLSLRKLCSYFLQSHFNKTNSLSLFIWQIANRGKNNTKFVIGLCVIFKQEAFSFADIALENTKYYH